MGFGFLRTRAAITAVVVVAVSPCAFVGRCPRHTRIEWSLEIVHGEMLDNWGHMLGEKRENEEPDVVYRKRLMARIKSVEHGWR
jgi:hypothetical protein